MWKGSLSAYVPLISWPVIVTFSIFEPSTSAMKSLNGTGFDGLWKRLEKLHTPSATTTRTIQNTKLFNVEFTLYPPTT